MKKTMITLILVLFLGSLVRGQAALLVLLLGDKVASEKFYFSIKLGANVSNLSGMDDTNTRTGLNFGLLANMKLSDKFSLVGEFAPLSHKGAKNIPLVFTGNPNLDALLAHSPKTLRALNYIDIAVVGKYHLNDRISIGAGPYLGILTQATDIYKATVFDEDDLSYEENIKSGLKGIDYGAVFELSYTLSKARGGKGLVIHARYQWGLADIIKDNPGNAINNSTFQLMVSFPFIKKEEEKK